MKERIDSFIKGQTCASICCVDEKGKPYCFSCFYAFNCNEVLLYFKSSAETTHSKILLKNRFIAGTILPDKMSPLHMRGVQFEGEVLGRNHPYTKNAATHYYSRIPLAMLIPGEIWTIQLLSVKFTDNKSGFGNKTTWKRSEQLSEKINPL